MKRLTSIMLCSTLLLGLISNSRILNSYAEEDQAITASQVDKEAVATENQEEQKNESTTETTTEGTSIPESDASEVPTNPEEKNINDVPRTKNEPIEKSSGSSKKKAANSVLATTPDQATTEDGQALDIAHTMYELSPDKKSIILTSYTGNKQDLVIPSQINYNGMSLAVKIKLEYQDNAVGTNLLFPASVKTIKFVSVGGTKVELVNNVSNGVSLNHLFASIHTTYSNLTSIDFTGLDMDNVVSMFAAFDGNFLPNLTTLSFGENKLPNVTSMRVAFNQLKNLTTIQQEWTFGHLQDMYEMFWMSADDSSQLTSIGDTSNWNTSAVTNMSGMFLNCVKLQSLDLSNWDTSNVTDMSNMFWNCQKLSSIGDTSNWDVSHVTDFSGMFLNCASLNEIRMDNWNFQKSAKIGGTDMDNQSADNSPMFYLYSRGYDPLPALIVTSNKQLIDYPYAKAGYEPKCEIRINTNTGTLPEHLYWNRKDDKDTDLSYYFYQTAIPTNTYAELQSLSGEQLQNKVREWLKNNIPTKPDYALTGWAPTDQAFEQKIQSITDFNTFISSKEEFKANWVSDKFDTSPDNKKLNPTGSLGLAYYPTAFTINSSDLHSSGKQQIPISKKMSLNLGVKDRTRTSDKWRVTAQLTWIGNQLPNAYITATNTGTVTQNISTGLDGYLPSKDLTSLTGNGIEGITNYQINGNASLIMESNGTMVNNGVYDFNLGEAELVIPDVSQVAAGHYQGQVNWNLIISPS